MSVIDFKTTYYYVSGCKCVNIPEILSNVKRYKVKLTL